MYIWLAAYGTACSPTIPKLSQTHVVLSVLTGKMPHIILGEWIQADRAVVTG